ncbi:putative transcription factor C2H2 family [Helianthus annuus]|nr:putative transcription factor C2H2 family [Helianthus annuus]KAJ0922896.1 putative transcription factor C2H2 family [Helianthus annuus]
MLLASLHLLQIYIKTPENMICLLYDGYGASTSLVFITCVWVPFIQLKNIFFKIISVLMTMLCLSQHHHDHGIARDHNACGEMFPNVYHLLALPFHDVGSRGDDGTASNVEDDICSICLSEFGDGDGVSQLDKCHHVFHKCCIVLWLDHGHFTCPLCRSSLLNVSCKLVV